MPTLHSTVCIACWSAVLVKGSTIPTAAAVLNDIATTTTAAIADKIAAVAGVPKLK
jgi:hypothetical protein